MFDFLRDRQGEAASKDVARERLRAVLVRDRNEVTPQLLEVIRADMLRVLRAYVDIDESAVRLRLRGDGRSARGASTLECLVPVQRVRDAGKRLS